MITGPWRSPRQLLSKQEIESNLSIHDDMIAQLHGYEAGTIEGPTHFSQFVPLCLQVWGDSWIETGCLSVQYEAPCYEGESTQAHLVVDDTNELGATIKLTKQDNTVVLSGTASLGPYPPKTALDRKFQRVQRVMAKTDPSHCQLMRRSVRYTINPGFEKRLGPLYPFSLKEKLDVITEPSPWYQPTTIDTNPWGRAIIPMEFISPLLRANANNFPFESDERSVHLFADQEIQMISGPMHTEEKYDVEHELVASYLSQRAQNCWVDTTAYNPRTARVIAKMRLNIVALKKSLPKH